MYRFLYILSIIGFVFGTSVCIGPATPRQFMAVVLFLSMFINRKYLHHYDKKMIILYLIFLVMYGVSSMAEGRINEYLRELVSLYFVGILCYLNTIIYFERYRNFDAPLMTIYCSGVINTIVNALQYINHPVGIALGTFFVNQDNEQKVSMFYHLSQGESGSLLFGLLGDPVLNGYFSMLIPLLALYFINNNRGISRIIHWGVFAFSFIILFLIQQRAAFLITGVLSAYVLIRRFGLKTQYVMISFFALLILALILPEILNSDAVVNSRFSSNEEDSRIDLYSKALQYIWNNPIVGGITGFVNYAHNMPHNVLFNAFIYSGFIGGFSIFRILVKQYTRCLDCLKQDDMLDITLLFAAYTLNGFVHNPSLVTGDAILFMLWGMLYISSKYKLRIN